MNDTKLVRRVVTGHDDGGRAVFQSDDRFPLERIAIGGADFALVWTTATVPADNNDPTDGRERDAGLTIHAGSVIRVTDLLPGSVSPMHRTASVDYGIVLSGHVDLVLDDDVTRRLGPGDIAVQRGTMHTWRNPSANETCRIVFVLIEAKPYLCYGTPLPELQP